MFFLLSPLRSQDVAAQAKASAGIRTPYCCVRLLPSKGFHSVQLPFLMQGLERVYSVSATARPAAISHIGSAFLSNAACSQLKGRPQNSQELASVCTHWLCWASARQIMSLRMASPPYRSCRLGASTSAGGSAGGAGCACARHRRNEVTNNKITSFGMSTLLQSGHDLALGRAIVNRRGRSRSSMRATVLAPAPVCASLLADSASPASGARSLNHTLCTANPVKWDAGAGRSTRTTRPSPFPPQNGQKKSKTIFILNF